MKQLALLCSLVIPLSAAWCQSATSLGPSAQASIRVQTEGDFLNLLLATAWSWERAGNPAEEINFFADGTAQHTVFLSKFKVKNDHEITLEYNHHVAKLTFDPTYANYNGTDLDGATLIHGTRKNDPPVSLAHPPPPVPLAQLTQALVENSWAFEAPRFGYKARRKFNLDGSWNTSNDSLFGTWRIQDNKLLISLGGKPNSPEVFRLPPRTFNPAAHKIHLEGSGSNLDAVKLEVADTTAPVEAKPSSEAAASYFGTRHP